MVLPSEAYRNILCCSASKVVATALQMPIILISIIMIPKLFWKGVTGFGWVRRSMLQIGSRLGNGTVLPLLRAARTPFLLDCNTDSLPIQYKMIAAGGNCVCRLLLICSVRLLCNLKLCVQSDDKPLRWARVPVQAIYHLEKLCGSLLRVSNVLFAGQSFCHYLSAPCCVSITGYLRLVNGSCAGGLRLPLLCLALFHLCLLPHNCGKIQS